MAVLLLAGLVIATAPTVSTPVNGSTVSAPAAWAIIQSRCTSCHAKKPVNTAFISAPLGIELDSMDGLRLNAERVYQATVINRTMPLGNLTQMTDAERHAIANWFENSSYNSIQ